MKMFSFTLIGLLLSGSAFAIDTALCPEVVNVEMTSVTAFKSSINSSMEGWKSARKTLSFYETPAEFQFKLTKKLKYDCNYTDANGAKAKLTSLKIYDAEDNRTTSMDALLIQFADDTSTFTTLLEVKSYDLQGLTLFNEGDETRSTIRTPLVAEETGKTVYIDVGLARFDIK